MANEVSNQNGLVTRFGELRSGITDQQRAILDMVWTHVRDNKVGIPERPLYRKYREETVRQEMMILGDSVLRGGHEDGQMRYNIGFVGLFLSSDGLKLEALVKRYLQFLKKCADADPDIEKLSSKDLAKMKPLLTVQEMNELQAITYRANGAFASSFGGAAAEEWLISIRTNVYELDDVINWDDYFSREVLKVHDRGRSDQGGYNWGAAGNLFPNPYPMQRSASNEASSVLDLSFIDDEPLRLILNSDWNEASRVIQVKAWKSCMIMCGCILEGLLLWKLGSTQDEKIGKSFEDMSLGELVDECQSRGLLSKEDGELTNWARKYRNVIHPANQKRSGRAIGESHATIALHQVKVVAESFMRHSKQKSETPK